MGDKAALAAMGISEAPPPKVVESSPHFTSHAEELLQMRHLMAFSGLGWMT